jgi:hypothetical protein
MAGQQSWSDVKIVSAALVSLGERPVSDITEETRDSVPQAVSLLEGIYESELTTTTWRFASAQKELDRLSAQPLYEYRFVHQLPADRLRIFRAWPVSDYEIYGDRLYSNHKRVYVDYTFKPAYSQLPTYFAWALIYRLARDMAVPTRENSTRVEDMELRYRQALARAMWADASSRPNRAFEDSPFTDNR